MVRESIVRIGSKNFTEQLILSAFMAPVIETRTLFEVERYSNLGGTTICHETLIGNDLEWLGPFGGRQHL
jgi:glycine betaine/choline ABC-type transport system substrate-binding protein